MAAISLMTDFGVEDPYVGLVKGVILTINPRAVVVDLTHAIPPYDRALAARTLAWAYPYFPSGTVHTVVVDPGVGSPRGIIALRHRGHLFLGPDNGVLSGVLAGESPQEIVAVQNESYFRPSISTTFHGRDIFAPAAAHLSRGTPLAELGPQLDPRELVRLDLSAARLQSPGRIRGSVVAVDRFGNLVTDIPRELLVQSGAWACREQLRVQCGTTEICGLADHYQARPAGAVLALVGSRETLEISINQGHAGRELHAGQGQSVAVTWPAGTLAC